MYPEWKKGLSDMIGADTGADQDAEQYLYQQKQAARQEKERQDKRKKNAADVAKYEYRFYHREYKGKSAVVAGIIDKKHNLPRADYGVLLIDAVISDMKSQSPSEDLSLDEILTGSNDYRKAVLAAYDAAVKRTHAKTDTQLGLQADHVTYS